MTCRAELCPMWDGDTCPCETFGIDPDNPPRSGIFTTTAREDGFAAAEVAISTAALLLIGLLLLGFARASAAKTVVTAAAQNAARAASHTRDAGSASSAGASAAQQTLESKGVSCAPAVSIDTSGFTTQPGQAATARSHVTCSVPLSDLSVPGMPGSVTFTADALSAIDTYRER
ncbi:pilus assembly protein [Dermacoccus sp. Tok2021]|uniref:pilus assembly protein n=1 Tax=Dermacoccus sp. Tok2021 TaxID=2826873 RepID=UPI001CA6B636|nr:pilus assembly protein [Dermacoccus sp. Tok2021]MBZ4497986.1 pilus assembly protein [Dermacoccus sp. Tok2021]